MPELNSNQLRALRLLGNCTRSQPFHIWGLAGTHNAGMRQQILCYFHGKKVPKNQAGVIAMRDAFYKALEITGECEAEREENFVAKAKELTVNAA